MKKLILIIALISCNPLEQILPETVNVSIIGVRQDTVIVSESFTCLLSSYNKFFEACGPDVDEYKYGNGYRFDCRTIQVWPDRVRLRGESFILECNVSTPYEGLYRNVVLIVGVNEL
jgi:hypothetical protein